MKSLPVARWPMGLLSAPARWAAGYLAAGGVNVCEWRIEQKAGQEPDSACNARINALGLKHIRHPVLCENSADRLRGGAVIKLEHAAESLTAPYWARSEWRGLRRDELVAQTLVRSFLVIMIHERADGIPEVFLAERHDSV